ncbi:chromate transporter [Neobacillus citreus]|uniref:Chromate transporter n=1 Tax=Neobacillus citreus TaxID=2833578 RepID=A0A942T116_9BACI|nr:chromate transporter [Neobacillus citreus]MCH6268867.1 chromate transporter [Neobacillus citreus]
MKQYLDLFVAFFRSGMLGFGGGPSAIPLVHKEVVGTFKWMNDEEFGDTLALANALPGPINTKMAGYIGYRVAGILGLFTAILSSILPTIALMIILLTSLSAFKDQPWVQGMTKAVVPVVGVMLAVLTWQFFQNGQKGMGWKGNLAMVVVSFVIMEILGIHPGVLIAGLLAWALFGREKKAETEVVEKERKTI